MDISETELVQDVNTPDHPARKAFILGYAETANRLRRQNLDLADAGSPAADEACRGYLRQMTIDINL